jgi:WD40 repeat protein
MIRKGIWTAIYSPDGKHIYAGTSSSKLFVLSTVTFKYQEFDLSADFSSISHLALSPDGQVLAVVGSGKNILFLDAAKPPKRLAELAGSFQ